MPRTRWRRRFAIFTAARFRVWCSPSAGAPRPPAVGATTSIPSSGADTRTGNSSGASEIQNVIAQISGTVAQKIPGEVIVDVAGLGYEVLIPLSVFYQLPEIGAPLRLQIHTHVREDALQLFGFQDFAEKQKFLLLIGVSGIGPKLAVNILSGITAAELKRALREGGQARLVAIPGVGRKLAERLIVELKDRIATLAPVEPESGRLDGGSQLLLDAVSALVNLGYKRPDAEKMVREVMKRGAQSLESVLKESLRHLSP